MKTVIFGGTFNPVHNGHINLVNAVIERLSPERLIVIPSNVPPHKVADCLASDADRMNMLALAFEDIPNVTVSDCELTRDGRSYTVDTLEYFSKLYPNDELYFVMGTDMLKTLPNWHRADRIMQLATLLGVSRDDNDDLIISDYAENIRRSGGRCEIVKCMPYPISSTEIRENISSDIAKNALPEKVYKYICEHRLYQKQDAYPLTDEQIAEYKNYITEHLSQKRCHHSMCVAKEAVNLAQIFGCDKNKALVCGLLHDVCKEIPYDEQLMLAKRSGYEISEAELSGPKTYHGIAAVTLIKEKFGISDEDILNAIRYHTVARGNMSLLEKIVYMADLISEERSYPDVERVRAVTRADIDLGMYEAMSFSIKNSLDLKRMIPHSTLEAYNEYVVYYQYTGAKDKDN